MQCTQFRSYAWILSLLVSAWLLMMPVSAAAQIIVTTTNDGVTDNTACSLRAAIIAANTDSAVGGCLSGSGADTISFDPALPQPAFFTLTHSGADENEAQTGDLDISGLLTISADSGENSQSRIVIDGNGTDRVFEILSGAQVTMTGITIRHGNPGLGANGGGILVDLTARLTISASQVLSNSALNGGGLQTLGRVTMANGTVKGNQGGGITNDGGLLTLNDVIIAHNNGGYGIRNQNLAVLTLSGGLVSTNQGGGIYNATSTATISNSMIISNMGGSGIYNTGMSLTRLTLKQSTILSNTATSGGGLYNEGIGAKTDINDSRISGNRAINAGGGLFNNGIMTVNNSTLDHNLARSGGGLHHFGGHLALSNDTITHNEAGDNGGGLYNGSDAVLNNITLVTNRADGAGSNLFNDEAEWAVSNTIVANAQSGANCINSHGFLKSLGHNLESANSCNFIATGDLTNTEPLLGPLQDNGGATVTHALLVGSPAINQGAACPATDQRGVARPQGAACDIGAYEFAPTADLTPPGPVVNLIISAITTEGATLAWAPANDNVGVAGYRIYAQKISAPQPPFLIGQVVGAGTTYTVTTLLAHTSYQLWVLAYDLAGNMGALNATTAVSLTTAALALGTVQIKIAPPLPTDHDPISITIAGVYTSSCAPHYKTHQRTGNLITITSAPSAAPFCLPAEFPWGYTVGVDALPAGRYTVTHTLGQTIDQTVFTVTVVESPAPPVFHVDGTQAQTIMVGTPFHYTVQATGLPTPIYTLMQAPSGMTIDTTSGQITWLPTAAAVGEVTVVVRAANSLGNADYTFTVVVQTTNANKPRIFLPVVTKT